MKIKTCSILSSITLLLFVLLAGCSRSESLWEMRKKAVSKFEDFLHEDRINAKLFVGPKLNLENEKYFIFEWRSRLPHTGALTVGVYVPRNPFDETIVSGKGDQKNWWYLVDTRDKLVNEAMLGILFNLPISPNDTSERTKRLGRVPLTFSEMEDVVNFIEIKRQLREYFFKTGTYPIDLYDLNLEWRLTRDSTGNKYSYKSMGSHVILGTPGPNMQWDIDSSSFESLFSDEQEYIHQTNDDFLVKFMPVMKRDR